jgi:acyl carrier protein
LKDIMTIRSTILTTFETVGREQEKSLAPLSNDLPLLESGLDSLCIAIIVARLEDSLGLSPFDTEEEIEFPVTVGDFIEFYETAAARERAS